MLTAGGNETQVTRAKSILWNTIIGILIAFSSWVIVNTIINTIASDQFSGKWYNFPGCSGGTSPIESEKKSSSGSSASQQSSAGQTTTSSSEVVISKPAISSLALAETASWYAALHDRGAKNIGYVPGVDWAAAMRMFLASSHGIKPTNDFAEQAITQANAVLSDPNSNEISRQIANEAKFIAQHSFRAFSFTEAQSADADVAQNYAVKASAIAGIVKAYTNFAPNSDTAKKSKEVALLLDGYPFAYSEAVFSVPLPEVSGNDRKSILNSYKSAAQAQLVIVELIPALISHNNYNRNKNLAAGLGALLALGDGGGVDGGIGDGTGTGDADSGVGGGIGPGDAGIGEDPGGTPESGGITIEGAPPGPADDTPTTITDPHSPSDDPDITTPTTGPTGINDDAPENEPGPDDLFDSFENDTNMSIVASNTNNAVVAAVDVALNPAGLSLEDENNDVLGLNPPTDEPGKSDTNALTSTNMSDPGAVAALAAVIAENAQAIALANPDSPVAGMTANTSSLGAINAVAAADQGDLEGALAGLAQAANGFAATVDTVQAIDSGT